VNSNRRLRSNSAISTVGCYKLFSRHGRTVPLGCLALGRWAGWSAVQVGRHVKLWSRSNDLPR